MNYTVENSIQRYKDTKYHISMVGKVYEEIIDEEGRTALKEVKQYARGNDYRAVRLYDKLYLVHRLVLQTFTPTDDETLECDHIDGNTINNHLSNLRWVTRAENNRNKHNKYAKLTDTEVLSIVKLKELGYTYIDLAQMYSTSHNTIYRKIKQYKQSLHSHAEQIMENGNDE